MRKNTQGFTLIELLIVIAIIGILAAVLIPNLLSARERAFDAAAQSCLKEVSTAQEIYQVDVFEYSVVNTAAISACDNIVFTVKDDAANATTYEYVASHPNGSALFSVVPGSGVTRK